MHCISPMSIRRPNGLGATDRITIPCGKCPICYEKKRSDWTYRLMEELKNSSTSYFVTLTYSEPSPKTLNKMDVQLFLKRLRQKVSKIEGNITLRENLAHISPERQKLRYFLTGEYGNEGKRPHYHMVIFNLPYMGDLPLKKFLEVCWRNGFVDIGTVTEASIKYTTKYLLKGSIIPEGCENPFSLMSRKPGIGYDYVKRMGDWHQEDQRFYGIKEDGVKVGLPRYYRDKIFSKYDIEENKEDILKQIEERIRNSEKNELLSIEQKNEIVNRFKRNVNKQKLL